jgi:hypothetical protein
MSIKVGDYVKSSMNSFGVKYLVLGLCGDEAWVKSVDNGYTYVTHLYSLTPILRTVTLTIPRDEAEWIVDHVVWPGNLVEAAKEALKND